MSDVRYLQQRDNLPYSVWLDFFLSPLKLVEDGRDLHSAFIVALGTDALADEADPLPDPNSTDRKGWWGDVDAEEIWGGWPVGSKLWLLRRSKITSSLAGDGGTVFRAQSYAREAIQPFEDNSIISSADVVAERADVNRIDMTVIAYRGPERAVELRYSELWDDLLVPLLGSESVTVTPDGTLDFSIPGNPLIVTI